MVGLLLLGTVVFPAQAAFTALYVFGDGLSTTTDNPSPGPLYYGKRYSNGRVWVEVLAQRQGLTYDPNKNWSYFYNSSTTLVANVSSFQAPSDASNALFVIWVNCADLWFPATYNGASTAQWTSAINQAQTNHYKAVTNLYFAKGARTLIMPNAVDLSTIPEFNTSVNANFIHLRCLDYNVAFSNTLNRIRASCPNLTLYTPDFYALLNNMLAHPANYGVTNALGDGLSIDAIDAVNYGFPSAATNGFGTNFIFWNVDNPTAMVHAWMANLAQQLISPVRISQLTALNGSNRLDMANVPIGQNGIVIGRTNLVLGNWTTNATFVSSNATQSVFVTPSGPLQFYRLSFSFSWTWP
jgi:phospholipase/lecithinase/hemolysin